jgi:5-methylcytosine-specific restriction endonuclease McrA
MAVGVIGSAPDMADRALGAVGPWLEKPSRFRDRKIKVRDREAERREVYDAVNRRDRYRCVVCGAKADPRAIGLTEQGHHHHILYRSRGGKHQRWNVCLLCPACHAEVHAKRLFLSGNADEGLTIEWLRR